ncbi:MAG: class I adenylate-forming enzyme family protein [Cyanobacteria bacterium P01_H01_bin.15]
METQTVMQQSEQGTPLQSLLATAVAERPNELAIRSQERSVTYAQLDRLVGQVAAGMLALEVETGDRVAWLLPNSLEAVLVTLACYRIGAVAVPLNYRYVSDDVLEICERVDSSLIVFQGDRLHLVKSLLAARPSMPAIAVGLDSFEAPKGVKTFESLLAAGEMTTAATVAETDPALILFTSGSTGHPKGVTHSHASAFLSIDTSRKVFDFTANDVVLVGKPISHAGGLQTQLFPALTVGARVILDMRPEPADAVRTIVTEGVTEYGLLASDLLDFIEYLEANPTELPTLTNCIGSGDAVPADLHHRFRDLFGWEVMEGAGMTEIAGYYAMNPRFGQRKWGSLGLPTPGTEIRVVRADGEDCDVGETGEILLRTPAPILGYWNDETATAELFRGGWLHTGDLGRLDDDGYVWFVGRKKLIIVRRGSNIAPPEVENVLDEYPLVHATVVVGLKDPRDGQVPVACVALLHEQDETTEVQLRAYASEHLAQYKNPVHYLYVDELPRTSTGKYDRHAVQEIVAERFAGVTN